MNREEAVHANSNSKLQYCFGKGEDLPQAVRRIVSEQLTQSVQVLGTPEDSLEQAVHEARRCIKRTRSALRLVKFTIPNAYAQENCRLRNVGRSLSELRDSHALIKTLEELEKQGPPGGSRHRSFAKAHNFLETREKQITQAMQEGGMENSIAQLNQALIRLDRLTFTKVDLPGISKSLYKSVKRGMKAFAAAEDDGEPEKFHEWRKRAKDLRYQLSLLSELSPHLKQYSKSAKKLEQLLGDDHNLAVLTDLLGDEFRSIRPEIARQQKELRDQAAEIGSDLYGKKRKTWKHRLAPSAMEQ
jgi:CHAD domain-containing protein